MIFGTDVGMYLLPRGQQEKLFPQKVQVILTTLLFPQILQGMYI